MTAVAVQELAPFDYDRDPSSYPFPHTLLTPSGWQHRRARIRGEEASPEPRRPSNK
jgi:hypothetical protein